MPPPPRRPFQHSKGRKPGPPSGNKPESKDRGWDAVASWYDKLVGESGSNYHQNVILPAALRMLDPQPGESVIDIRTEPPATPDGRWINQIHVRDAARAIAHLLQPQRVWVAWKLIAPGQDAGMAYDGLVWLDDHWAWFPKPFRFEAAVSRR